MTLCQPLGRKLTACQLKPGHCFLLVSMSHVLLGAMKKIRCPPPQRVAQSYVLSKMEKEAGILCHKCVSCLSLVIMNCQHLAAGP